MHHKRTFFEDMLKALEDLSPRDRRELMAEARKAGVPLADFVLDLYNRQVRKLRRQREA
jgi:hypothetical protein